MFNKEHLLFFEEMKKDRCRFFFVVITRTILEYSSIESDLPVTSSYNDEEGMAQGGARNGNIKSFSKI